MAGLRGRRRRGLASVWVLTALVPLVGIAALTIDVGCLYVAKQQLQNAADAAALAAAGSFTRHADAQLAVEEAVAIAAANSSLGKPVVLDPSSDVVFGTLDQGTGEFVAGMPDDELPLVKVTARRTEESASGPVPMAFARTFGIEQVSLSASATATSAPPALNAGSGGCSIRTPLELVILQDVSQSFLEELGQAKNADSALVQLISDAAVAGDRVGVVRFRGSAARAADLTSVPDHTALLKSTIDAMQWGEDLAVGTHTGAGIDEAAAVLAEQGLRGTKRVIVLVSDGMPEPQERRPMAVAAADAAAAQGIVIHTVTFIVGSEGDAEFNASLCRNGGHAFHTPDPQELDDILLEVGVIEIGHPRLIQ